MKVSLLIQRIVANFIDASVMASPLQNTNLNAVLELSGIHPLRVVIMLMPCHIAISRAMVLRINLMHR